MSPNPTAANSANARESSHALLQRSAQALGASELPDWTTEAILRATTALGLVAIALVHFLDLFSKLRETPYLGVAYIALIGGCLLTATQLVTRTHHHAAWRTAGALAAATFLAYAISRSVGFPHATDDIGNWEEPLGLASLFVEGLVVLLTLYALAYLPRDRKVASDTHDLTTP